MIYEYRVYTFKTSEVRRMLSDGFPKFFRQAERHGFRTIGPLKTVFGNENQVSYFWLWENLDDRKEAFESFQSDPEVQGSDWVQREQLEGPLRYSCVSKIMETLQDE
tara:strand:+ start:560 stop:880 length:321 start_codon:yes stop_codon:yes gene_type:complete